MRFNLLLLFALVIRVHAQKDSVTSIQTFTFGFNVGYSRSAIFAKCNNSNPMKINNGNGILMGMNMQSKVHTNWIMSTKAELNMINSSILHQPDNTTLTTNIFPIYTNVMIHFLHNINNKGLYVFAGPNIKSIIKRTIKKEEYKCKQYDIALDVGLGYHKNLNYFSYAPEIRYSFGLTNVNTESSFKYIYFHTVSLIMNIKGV